jgi:RNA polymerase sigma-70 factor (TIGR02957 family)
MVNQNEAEQLYTDYKPLLFSLAYRMLGSVMDAEDIVQEVFLTLNESTLADVQNPKSYLCKMVTNRCIDRLRATKRQREVYVGPWLPEPLVTDLDEADPDKQYLQKEAVSTAYLLLLQQLSWAERTVFLLREVLQYEYDEIAEIVGKSSANCRQIFHRAKRSLGNHAARDAAAAPSTSLERETATTGYQTNSVVEQFATALASGNIGRVLSLLSADSTLYSDGGGKVHAALLPIQGAERVARFLTGVLEKVPGMLSYRFAMVGGQRGIVSYVDGHVANVVTFRVEDGRIAAVYIVVNPDKLRHVKL